MSFDGPTPQRRGTVLVRLILAIPQFIVLFLLEIALFFVAVIGWFAALFMGRLPVWAHQFNSGFVSWSARVSAYLYLLTDEYPPFEFDTRSYPIRPFLPPPGKLNRLAVFFRLILFIPAFVFQMIVSYGLSLPLLLITWLILVFTGRMPPQLYWAYAALLRYETRFYAYMLLVTPEYPWGMFGDGPPEASPGSPAPTASIEEAAPVPYAESPGEAAARVPPPAPPAWPPPPPPNWAQGGTPPPLPHYPLSSAPDESGGAGPSRLVLPSGSRGWLIFAIVWGVLVLGVQVPLQVKSFTTNVNLTSAQYDTVLNDYNESQATVALAERCTTIACLHTANVAVATSFDQFDSNLVAMNLSPFAQDRATLVLNDLSQLSTAFTALSNSPSLPAYRSRVQTSQVSTLLLSLQNDTTNLLNALRTSIF